MWNPTFFDRASVGLHVSVYTSCTRTRSPTSSIGIDIHISSEKIEYVVVYVAMYESTKVLSYFRKYYFRMTEQAKVVNNSSVLI